MICQIGGIGCQKLTVNCSEMDYEGDYSVCLIVGMKVVMVCVRLCWLVGCIPSRVIILLPVVWDKSIIFEKRQLHRLDF